VIYIIKTLAFGKRQTTLFIYYFVTAPELIAMMAVVTLAVVLS
jgi:hypothetical protein